MPLKLHSVSNILEGTLVTELGFYELNFIHMDLYLYLAKPHMLRLHFIFTLYIEHRGIYIVEYIDYRAIFVIPITESYSRKVS
jgi:hypothetical protein